MTAPPLTLAPLLAPVTPARFFEAYWERQPLYVPCTDPSWIDDLPRLAETERLLSLLLHRHAGCAVELVSEHRKVRHGRDADFSEQDVAQAFAEGSTVRIIDADQALDGVRRLVAAIEEFTSAQAGVNVYLTPRGSQAFPVHRDPYATFIVQTTGAKRWEVFAGGAPLPMRRAVPGRPSLFPGGRQVALAAPPPREGAEPLLDVTLRPGDLLYVPGGSYHRVRTTDTLSLHLTVALYPFTWHDAAVRALYSLLTEHEQLRRALPPGFARPDADEEPLAAADQLADLLREHLDGECLRRAVEEHARRFTAQRRGALHGRLADLDRLETLDADSRLQVRPDLTYRLEPGSDYLHLYLDGDDLRLPGRTEPLVRHMAGAGRFRVGDLPTRLSERSKLTLARHLLKHGFLTLAGTSARTPHVSHIDAHQA